jgi:CSLREA domain-containing protein
MTRARSEQDGSGAILEHLESRLLLSGTTYLVDSLADVVAADGATTLREAIQAANTNLVVHDAPAGSSTDADIITFAASLSGGTITLDGTRLVIIEDLEIRGLGSEQLTIDADGRSGAFSLAAGVSALFDAMTITGGYAPDISGGGYGGGIHGSNDSIVTVTNSMISGNAAESFGGGIYGNDRSTVIVKNSTISDNSADRGAGGIRAVTVTLVDSTVVANSGYYQYGAVYGTEVSITDSVVSDNSSTGVYAYEGVVTVSGSVISDNVGFGIYTYNASVITVTGTTISNHVHPNGNSGGIMTGWGSTVVVEDSTISGNSGNGGVTLDDNSELIITNSVISGNSSYTGAGIGAGNNSNIAITGSTIGNNTAGNAGGGIAVYGSGGILSILDSTISNNYAESRGGGVFANTQGNVTVTNSTIADNSTDSAGAGLYVYNGTDLVMTNSTVVGNSSADIYGGIYGRTTLNNSVVALNVAERLTVDIESYVGSNNFIGTDHGDPMLTPVNDSQGVVLYYIPLPGSPLIDAGDNSLAVDPDGVPLAGDQRGRARIGAAAVDIGSVEFRPLPELYISPVSLQSIHEGQSATFEVSLTMAPSAPVTVNVDWQPGGSSAVSADISVLTFDAGDWNAPQPVTITVGQDANVSNETTFFAVSASDMDTTYVPVSTIDDDPQIYVVDSLLDVVADDGVLTLREAIEAANTNMPVNEAPVGSPNQTDIVTFDPSLSGGTIVLDGMELKITEDLEVRGLGADELRIDADGQSRVFWVDTEISAAFDALTISGGRNKERGGGIHGAYQGALTVTNSIITGNWAGKAGGGIYGYGEIVVADSTISGNTVEWTSLSSGNDPGGGGIYGGTGTAISVTNSTISGNVVIGNRARGGGIRGRDNVTVSNSTISYNSSEYGGGGVYCSGVITMTDSAVFGNSAGQSGGGVTGGSEIIVTNSLINGNVTGSEGGGIHQYSSGARVVVTNSTVGGNTSETGGGGIDTSGGVTATNSTVVDNVSGSGSGGIQGGSVLLENSVVAQNSSPSDPDVQMSNLTGSSYFIGSDDGDPMLRPIIDADGVTLYYMPAPGSPLVDAGDNSLAVDPDGATLTTDQSGRSRIVNATVDIGAIELAPGLRLTVAPQPARILTEGESTVFNVSLTRAPATAVTVTVVRELGGSSDISSDVSVLTFDSGDWDTPKPVTITANHDADHANEAAAFALSASGMDTIYVHVSSIDDNPQIYVVDSLLDVVAADGVLTLREAVMAANTNAPVNEAPEGSDGSVDIITFDASLSGGTITLLDRKQLDISEDLEIRGLGADQLTVDGGQSGSSRVMFIDSGISVLIDSITVSGGQLGDNGGGIYMEEAAELTFTNSTLSDNYTGDYGGGIYAEQDCVITVINSLIDDNFADDHGGGIYGVTGTTITITDSTISANRGDSGGVRSGGSVSVTNSTITGNLGSGLYADTLTVTDSLVTDNSSSGLYAYNVLSVTGSEITGNLGRGLYSSKTLTVTDSLITGNSGGGVYGSNVTVIDSMISGNSSGSGGGVDGALVTVIGSVIRDNSAANDGGGIYGSNSIEVTNSTISGNSAKNGGGIYSYKSFGSGLTLTNSTIVGNSASVYAGGIRASDNNPTLVLHNTVVAENTAPISPDMSGLISAKLNGFIGSDDGDPMLRTIRDASGGVLYYIPEAGSPLINAGDNSLAVDPQGLPIATDQRDLGRVVNGTVDIGAIEFHALPGLLMTPPVARDMVEGESLEFDVSLISTPSTPVAVNVDRLPGGSGSISADVSVLEFDVDNWSVPQTVTITAVHDADFDNEAATFALSSPGMDSVYIIAFAEDDDRQTYVVDSLADVVAPDGMLTLREAIQAANTNSDVNEAPAGDLLKTDIITFAPSLAGGAITLDGTELQITEDLEIRGLGADELTIDADGRSRVFSVGKDVSVLFDSLTITGGDLARYGGGIYGDRNSALTVTNSTISANSADLGGGIYAESNAMQTVVNSTISGNTATGGGGVYTWGEMTVTDSTISDNLGGGLRGEDVTVTNSRIVGNSTTHIGGGIECANLVAVNSVIADNSALRTGGGVYADGDLGTITNSTIANNSAHEGGGIFQRSDDVAFALNNTVVALNTALSSPQIKGGYVASHSFIDGAPMVTPVTDASGMILHYMPQPGSPLIDAGDNSLAVGPDGLALTTDQRGQSRVVNAIVDIGSVELPTEPELAVTPTPLLDLIEGESQTFDVSLTSAPSAPVTVNVARRPGGSEEVSAGPSLLVFDADNWNTPQSVTITAAHDADRDNDDIATFAVSADGMDTIHVFVSVVDDDYQTYVVDSLADVVAADGLLTLREAIQAANTNTAVNEADGGGEGLADVVTFDPALFSSGPATIILTSDTIEIIDDLQIAGPGSDQLTVIKSWRLFDIAAGTEAGFSGLTLADSNPNPQPLYGSSQNNGGAVRNYGSLTLEGCVITGHSGFYGGGVWNDATGVLAITDCEFSNNGAEYGGGISNYGVVTIDSSTFLDNYGGGVHVGGGTATIRNSVVSGNSGSGIYISGGTVEVADCVIRDNKNESGGYPYGGGIYNNGTLTLTNTSVLNNRAVQGGGLASTSHVEATVDNCVFSGNFARDHAGGILASRSTITNSIVSNNSVTAMGYESRGGGLYLGYNTQVLNTAIFGNTSNEGGGVYIAGNAVRLVNSTISGNIADEEGGGVYVDLYRYERGDFGITNSTVTGNRAEFRGGGIGGSVGDRHMELNNSIVALNSAITDQNIEPGYVGAGNFVVGDPMLTAVSNENGTVLYYVPQAGSPVIDAADNALAVDKNGSALPTDQRGNPRINGPAADIGSIEAVSAPELSLTQGPWVELAEGESASFDIFLSAAPSGPVTVAVARQADGSEDLTADVASVTFGPGDWNIPQTVTISAAEDPDRDNDYAGFELSAPEMEIIRVFATAKDNDIQTYVVDSLADIVADDGLLTLREAIQAANTDAAVNEAPEGSEGLADIITFDPSLFGGTITLGGEELNVYGDMEILGPGADLLTINANQQSRILNVSDPDADLTLSGLTMTGGRLTAHGIRGGAVFNRGALTARDCVISNNSATYTGGIHNRYGTVVLDDCTVSGNASTYEGGGIGSTGVLTLSGVVISGNSSTVGAGIYHREGTLSLDDCVVSNNTGTGIDIDGGTASVTNSVVSDNAGTGVMIRSGEVILADSVISNNEATKGGGVYVGEHSFDVPRVTLIRCEVSGNSASGQGGGIRAHLQNANASLSVQDSTISGNTASAGAGVFGIGGYGRTITVLNTTVSDNVAEYGGGGLYLLGRSELTDCVISGNRVERDDAEGSGGGIRAQDATVIVTNCVISNNSVTSGNSLGRGGGIYSEGSYSNVTVTNSLVTGNSADRGGGVATSGGTMTLVNSTILDNAARMAVGGVWSANSMAINNTVIALNTAPDLPQITGAYTESHSFIDGDPMLTAVTDAGGMILHYMPQPGSPLIDAGDNSLAVDPDGIPLATDQIGNMRIFGPAVDIGAIEFMPGPPPTDISLSDAVLAENLPAGAIVGMMSSIDPDQNATHAYTMVDGPGDDGNGAFIIEGDTLKTVGSLNFELQDSYNIRIRSMNQSGGAMEKMFVVRVANVNELSLVNPIADVKVKKNAADTVLDLSDVFDDPDIGDVVVLTLEESTNTGLVAASLAGDQLTLAYAADQSGSAEITVRATDSHGLWVEDTFTVRINAVPIVSHPIADVIVDEDAADTVLDLSGAFIDIDPDDSLILSIKGTTNPACVVASLNGSQLTLSYRPDAAGVTEITVRATDSIGTWVENTFTVTVNPVIDDPPFVVNGVSNFTVAEDAADTVLDLSTIFDDLDVGDKLVFSISGNTNAGLVTTDLAGDQLALVYTADQYGAAQITVRATDLSGLWVEDAFTVTVNPDNDSPLVQEPIGDVTVNEDASETVLDLTNVFGDFDADDSLTLSVTGNTNAGLVATSIAGDQLTLVYLADQSGTAEITVRATDAAGAHVDDTFTVTVRSVNDAPFLVHPIVDVIDEENAADRVLDMSGVFDDTDIGDELVFSVTGNTSPELATTNIYGDQLTLIYAAYHSGQAEITVRATDLSGAWVDDTFSVTVSREPGIHGRKFDDLNANGVRDPGEPGLDGWTLELVNPASGEVVASTVTASIDLDGSGDIDPESESGLYSFTDMSPDFVSGQSIVHVIDNSDPGFYISSRSWRTTSGITNAYNGDVRRYQSQTAKAWWAFDNLPAGSYQIWTSWGQSATRPPAAAVRYNVYEGGTITPSSSTAKYADGTLVDSLIVDQTVQPLDLQSDGIGWRSLGEHLIDGQLVVEINGPQDVPEGQVQYAFADAVRIEGPPLNYQYIVRQVAQPGWTQTSPSGGEYLLEIEPDGFRADVDFGDHDIAAPVITVDSVTTADTSPALSGTVDDPTAGVEITVDGNTYAAINNGDGTWTLDAGGITPSLGQGVYDVVATASDFSGNTGTDITTAELTVEFASRIVGRHVFYNNSAWDADGDNDAAIATDKTALLSGQTAIFANYTSYSRGINGIMIDVDSLAATPTVGDFNFKVGNANDPGAWTLLGPDQQPEITVRPGAGVNGSDRITLIWADNVIEKQWLKVTVLTGGNIGLSADDVFYFGNAPGEAGNSDADAAVDDTDRLLARNNPCTALNPAGIDDAHDFNRDKKVNATDELIVRDNAATGPDALKLITAPGTLSSAQALVLAPLPGDADGNNAVDDGDMAILRSMFGQFGEDLAADFDHDGRVGLRDFVILRRNYGMTRPEPQAAPAPEMHTAEAPVAQIAAAPSLPIAEEPLANASEISESAADLLGELPGVYDLNFPPVRLEPMDIAAADPADPQVDLLRREPTYSPLESPEASQLGDELEVDLLADLAPLAIPL